MLKIAVCGGSGYVGGELLRILAFHPEVTVTAVTSERSAGKAVTAVFPSLYSYDRTSFEPLVKETLLGKADLFFLALPHAASQEAVDFFVSRRKRVIDISADYRISDPLVYEQWYKVPHNYRATLRKAVYGLTELHRKRIKRAALVANPGCYPTGAILGLYPALKKSLIDPGSIVIDSKSGASGAGRKAETAYSYCEVSEGFKAYGLATHRHTPEIEQELSLIAGREVRVNFTPHLLPVDRGILSTIYARLTGKPDTRAVIDVYRRTYGSEPFVRVLGEGTFPNIKNVRGTNFCEVGIKVNSRTNTLIVVTAIDNLVKGAAGQAVQNMNAMCGFPESSGLGSLAVFP